MFGGGSSVYIERALPTFEYGCLKKLTTEQGKIQVLGGIRGMTGLIWQTSLHDPDEGTGSHAFSCFCLGFGLRVPFYRLQASTAVLPPSFLNLQWRKFHRPLPVPDELPTSKLRV
ncbi:hypothetical protein AAC387_Pa02g3061 [Persea americana]